MSLDLPVQLDDKPEVNELYKALKNLTDWRSFALNLKGLEINHIQEIQRNERNLTDCKNDLYMKWLRVCPDAKWSDVVTALRAIDEHALADTLTGSTGGTSHTHSTTDTPIEEGVTRGTHPTGIDSYHGITQHLQTTGNIPQATMNKPSPTPETILNFPATSEEEKVILQQLTELHDSFTILLQDVRKHIEGLVRDQSAGQDVLYELAANLEDAGIDDRLANLTECKSAEEIWKKLRNVCNFFDGSILHGIVRFGRLHDKALESRTMEHKEKANKLMSKTQFRILKNHIEVQK